MTVLTALYAVPLALLFLVLSIRVIGYRRSNKLSLGDYGDKALLKRMRAQANFVEYAPFGLVLVMLVELLGASGWMVHLAALPLLLGRLAHAYGFGSTPQIFPLRTLGMGLTLTSIVFSAALLLVLGLGRLGA